MKRLIKKAGLLVLALALIMPLASVFTACDNTETPQVTIAFVGDTEITIQRGTQRTITVTITGTEDNAEFSSDNTAVVTTGAGAVKNSVRLTAVSKGTAEITATVSEQSAKLTVTVEAPDPVDSVDFAKTGVSIEKGSTVPLTVSLTYSTAAAGVKPVITSADTGMFDIGALQTVSETNDNFTATFTLALKSGTDYGSTELTATIGTLSDTLAVDVCSPGIEYSTTASSASALVVSGTTTAFTDGKLVLPRYGWSANEGNFVAVETLGDTAAATPFDNKGAAVTELVTGDSVELIASNVMKNVTTLQTITLGEKVATIAQNAFWNDNAVNALTTINFAEGNALETIGSTAFARANFTSLTLPDSITDLGDQAFIWNGELTDAVMPAGLVPDSNGNKGATFYECKKLERVTIPVYTLLEKSTFRFCDALNTITFLGTKAQWRAMQAESLRVFGNVDKYTYNSPAWDCANIICTDGGLPITMQFVTQTIETLIIGRSVDIEVSGTHLGNVTFTPSDTSIVTVEKKTGAGDNTDVKASATVTASLTNDGATTIKAAFDGIEVSLAVTVVNPYVDAVTLSGYTNTITPNNTYVSIGKDDSAPGVNLTYSSADYNGVTVTEPPQPTIALASGGDAVLTLGALTNITVDGDGLASAKLPITPIAFGTTTVTFVQGTVTKTLTVEICSSGIVFSAGVTTIETFATGVNTNFPGGMLQIPYRGLYNGQYLEVNRIQGPSGSGAISNTSGKAITGVNIGSKVSLIQPDAFNGITTLTTAVLNSNIQYIWERVFKDTGLTSITIPDSVTLISQYAFDGCSVLDEINFGANSKLATIDKYAFQNCHSLVDVDLSANSKLTVLGSGSFLWCAKLETIRFPDSLTSVGAQSFFGTPSLTEVWLPNNTTIASVEGVLQGQGSGSLKIVHMPAYTTLALTFFQNHANIETVDYAGTIAQFNAMKAASDALGAQSNGSFWTAHIICSDGTIN